jgi:hypothetical protein
VTVVAGGDEGQLVGELVFFEYDFPVSPEVYNTLRPSLPNPGAYWHPLHFIHRISEAMKLYLLGTCIKCSYNIFSTLRLNVPFIL